MKTYHTYKTIITGWALLAFARIAHAQENPFTLDIFNPLGNINSFAALAEAIFRAIVVVAIPLTVIFFIWGGFLFVTAQGNEQQIEKAKKSFFWTFLGGLVIVASWAIAVAINNSVQGL